MLRCGVPLTRRGLPTLVRTIGYLFDIRSSEIRLKTENKVDGLRFVNNKAPYTVIRQKPLQSVSILQSYSTTDHHHHY